MGMGHFVAMVVGAVAALVSGITLLWVFGAVALRWCEIEGYQI